MKARIQYILQRILGFDRYLFWFSLYKIRTLRKDQGEKDFFHFVDLLNSKETVLDIGANIGIMTVHLAKKVKDGSVQCFEPMPDNINALKKIVDFYRLNNVTIHDVALGNEDGEIEMVMPVVEQVRKQGLSHVVHEEMTDFNEGDRFQVQLRKLDTILADRKGRIQAIKMDVENFEYHVLSGAQQLLSEDRPIIYCELWDNDNRKKCFDLMRSLKYDITILDGDLLVEHQPDKHQTQNFFFIPGNS